MTKTCMADAYAELVEADSALNDGNGSEDILNEASLRAYRAVARAKIASHADALAGIEFCHANEGCLAVPGVLRRVISYLSEQPGAA